MDHEQYKSRVGDIGDIDAAVPDQRISPSRGEKHSVDGSMAELICPPQSKESRRSWLKGNHCRSGCASWR
jgi:ribosome modulation factor